MDIGTSKAAEILGVTQKTVQEWCRAGKFKTATQDGRGKPWHISEREVEQLMREREIHNRRGR